MRSQTFVAYKGCSGVVPLSPLPAKSKRSTPTPARATARDIRAAARLFFPLVKQCAKLAQPRGVLARGPSVPATHPPPDPSNTKHRLRIDLSLPPPFPSS